MAEPFPKTEEEQEPQEESISYRGTLLLSILLGLFIVTAWGYMFYTFVQRS
jgi:hypothetical protein